LNSDCDILMINLQL